MIETFGVVSKVTFVGKVVEEVAVHEAREVLLQKTEKIVEKLKKLNLREKTLYSYGR